MVSWDWQQKRMEKPVLPNSKQRTVDHPSTKSSLVLKSFVKDLCFWDIHKSETLNGMTEYNKGYGQDRYKREYVRVKKHKNIPTMKEAIDMHNEANYLQDKGSDHDAEVPKTFPKVIWKSAIDPESGKIYYYDAISRKTQWKKPFILEEIEKKRKKEKRRAARQFFDEMEKNVIDSMTRGEVIPGIPFYETMKEGPPKEPFPKSHVRTLSAMHGVLLEEFGTNRNTCGQDYCNFKPKLKKATNQKDVAQKPVHVNGRPPLPGSRDYENVASSIFGNKSSRNSVHNEEKIARQKTEEKIEHQSAQRSEDLEGDFFLTSMVENESYKLDNDHLDTGPRSSIRHTRRNTGGTIYLQNTMTDPDIKSTIKCVCGVFRAHIRQSIEKRDGLSTKEFQSYPEFYEFDDNSSSSKWRRSRKCPTLAEVSEFYEAFYQRSQMEHDTIIFSLIYVERLIKSSNGVLAPTPRNWRSLLFSCMVLASKVWDDFSMWNSDFANVTAHTTGLTSFTLSRINELELALLKCLKFNVRVPASEYAKYYFLIRSMLLQSGLVKEDEKPLGKKDASQKPEFSNSPYLEQCPTQQPRDRRSKSMDGSILNVIPLEKNISGGQVRNDFVCLEQLVH